MMEKIPITENEPQHYTPHLKKVLKTYQKSAIKSLQGPSTVLATDAVIKKEPASESSPELPLETPPPQPVPQVPILSTADQSAELSETLIEGCRISCFIIGGEKRICFVQLLSTVLRNVQAYTINNVCAELFINFSSCNSEQLLALKAKGLLPAETPTCGLVTKPDAERLCSVLLHEGGAAPEGLDKHVQSSFLVYHECFSGAKGVLYYEFYTELNWCVQCVVCRRLFTPQMFVCHSCYMDKKRNSIHTYIETGICHWGFDSTNWRLYIHVLEGQQDYEKYTEILDSFKKNHIKSDLIRLKRKQVTPPEIIEPVKPAVKSVIEETVPKIERDEEEEERWYLKKKAKVVTAVEDGTAVTCAAIPSYYGPFHTYYSNLCDSWVRNAAAAAGYHHATPWPNYPPIPFTKDSKSYYFTESVPAFLTQGPPVLLHPERVVSLSQSEQFERSFQPNVALAPPAKPASTESITYSKLKRSVIRVKSDRDSQSPTTEATEPPIATIYYKSEQDEDVKPQPVSPVVAAIPAASPRNSPVPEPTPDNGVNSVVEQVAAVLDALSDAEDAVRQRVISLVERLTLRIDKCEIERQKYQDDISQLRLRLSQLQEENVQLYFDNSQLRQQLEIKAEEKEHVPVVTPSVVPTITTPVINTSPGPPVTVLNNASYSYSNRNTPGISSKQPHCSPVSVITSPPPLSSIKSESAA